MLEFLSMGGYAAYVWPAFGGSALVMMALYYASVQAARKSASEFEALRAERRPRRSKRREPMVAKRASERQGGSAVQQAEG